MSTNLGKMGNKAGSQLKPNLSIISQPDTAQSVKFGDAGKKLNIFRAASFTRGKLGLVWFETITSLVGRMVGAVTKGCKRHCVCVRK